MYWFPTDEYIMPYRRNEGLNKRWEHHRLDCWRYWRMDWRISEPGTCAQKKKRYT